MAEYYRCYKEVDLDIIEKNFDALKALTKKEEHRSCQHHEGGTHQRKRRSSEEQVAQGKGQTGTGYERPLRQELEQPRPAQRYQEDEKHAEHRGKGQMLSGKRKRMHEPRTREKIYRAQAEA